MDADVIVIGAGAAGLAAARSLARRGGRVLLVEGRDRTGGRVWSRPGPRAVTPAELGAEFIHGPARQTMALLREAGSAAIATAGESWSGSGGALVRDDEDFHAAGALFESSLSREDESVDRFLRRFEDRPALREAARAARDFVEGFEAADPALASAQAIAREWGSGVVSTAARPLGGYGPLFEWLRAACLGAGVELALSAVVSRIAWRRGAVEIDVLDAAGEVRTWRARCAVVTLPVGVLRHRGDEREVRFEPALPHAKREALEKIEMGHAVKVALWFRTPFWERIAEALYRDGAFFHVEGSPIAAYWTQFPVRSELVVAWAGGPRAIALQSATDAERIDAALNGFAELCGDEEGTRAQFDGALAHDWSADPFSRGAYSYVAVGGGAARAALAEPLDETLFFAGEATATDGEGGTVNGAFATGERAADRAAAAIGLHSP